ncbi:MAG TPA: ClpXP protease specificity-enhancing factor SspB [Pseudolabrys sp.]|nr:ClpXP protease specificity-enhancing factor SspB [Pseudolabrys sp.]
MASDQIRYDLLTQQALRGVVRTILTDVAKKGLPGEHHFYISFDTQADGVRMSQRLRTQYPQEMTIILQHQFWDLSVEDDRFEVALSFGGVSEKLAIPFEAIKGFFDPSVQFGLQFEELTAEELAAASGKPKPVEVKKPTLAEPAAAAPLPAPAKTEAAPAAAEPTEKPASGAEVVRLDRFRKK